MIQVAIQDRMTTQTLEDHLTQTRLSLLLFLLSTFPPRFYLKLHLNSFKTHTK